MAQLKLRRAAACVLLSALVLSPVSAGAATRVHTHPHPAAASGIGIGAWVRSAVIDLLSKSGIRIDPNGGH